MVERKIPFENILNTLENPMHHVYDRWRDVYIAIGPNGEAVVYCNRGWRIEVLTILTKKEYGALYSRYGSKRYKDINKGVLRDSMGDK